MKGGGVKRAMCVGVCLTEVEQCLTVSGWSV